MDDMHYMKMALQEALQAKEEEEVPVGAVVVQDGKIISRGHNMTERLQDPTAHAEMIALTAAFNALGSKYLPDATLYVTVEPCPMCAGALYWSKIGRVVYGTDDLKNGYRKVAGSNWPFHPQTKLDAGCCAAEAAQLMKDFFKARR
ncbi:MAG: nucleoside deaminase [Chitinophagaceae bacterium]|jgi:tRNA(adenine34) deaminase|nr:nucleoside deaminase [Chitinophagaceae bacterium]NBX10629.1 nucleoside deaminase [Chitinophagaceae bacterium]NBY24530.1 nucleoside deaminase [Chitinophagaceae bacterium]NDB52691.1 nucleoside deaminase [Chitinophagaceae bacterium]NDE77697.1 nucleoside deaminase [Chitinophagaceae bacterium]